MTHSINLQHLKRTALATIIVASLTACGGDSSSGGGSSSGGSGGGTSGDSGVQTGDSEPTVQTAAIDSVESSQETMTVAGSIAQIEEVRGNPNIIVSDTATGNVSTASASTSNSSTIYISIGELQNDGDSRYRIHHQAGGTDYITTLNINAVNTSALDDVEKAEQITGLATNTLMLADEQRLSNILLQLEYLKGLTDPTTIDATKATIAESVNQATAASRTLKENLAVTLADYKAGKVGESTLMQKIVDMNGGLNEIATIGDIVLEVFDATLSELIANLPTDLSLAYDPIQGRYTRFTDASLGEYSDNGEWQFKVAYDWLNAALPMKDANN